MRASRENPFDRAHARAAAIARMCASIVFSARPAFLRMEIAYRIGSGAGAEPDSTRAGSVSPPGSLIRRTVSGIKVYAFALFRLT